MQAGERGGTVVLLRKTTELSRKNWLRSTFGRLSDHFLSLLPNTGRLGRFVRRQNAGQPCRQDRVAATPRGRLTTGAADIAYEVSQRFAGNSRVGGSDVKS